MALAQAHLHRHGGTATCRKTIAGHDGKGVIQWARWHNSDGRTWNGSVYPFEGHIVIRQDVARIKDPRVVVVMGS